MRIRDTESRCLREFEGRQVNCPGKRAAPQAPAEKCEMRADGRKGRNKKIKGTMSLLRFTIKAQTIADMVGKTALSPTEQVVLCFSISKKQMLV